MNRLSPTLRPKGRIRPRTTILSGAALGLLAGAAVFGAVSSSSAVASSSTPLKPALVSANTPVTLAPCAKGQKLEHGVCIVHVERIVTAASSSSSDSSSSSSDSSSSSSDSSSSSSDSSSSSSDSSGYEASEHADDAAHESAEHADDAAHETAEHASEATHEAESHS